jgi:hypothetical protein
VSLGTAGMVAIPQRIDRAVQNLWGLTRCRVVDFGRVTADR